MTSDFKALIGVPITRMGCVLAPHVGLLAALPMLPVLLSFP